MQATIETARSTVFTALAEAGFSVERIGELKRGDYRAAIPILLEWLPWVEDPYLRWAIVSALGVSWARPVAAPALIEEFYRAGDWPHGYKWAVGQALGDVADDSVWEDLSRWCATRRTGMPAREWSWRSGACANRAPSTC